MDDAIGAQMNDCFVYIANIKKIIERYIFGLDSYLQTKQIPDSVKQRPKVSTRNKGVQLYTQVDEKKKSAEIKAIRLFTFSEVL